MSSFLVSDDTINAIVTCLSDRDNEDLLPEYRVRTEEDKQKLAAELYELNILALGARYGDKADTFPPFEYHYCLRDPIIVFKNINCFIYQCSEGNVPELPLYKAIDTAADKLAAKIVRRLPAYDVADWG